MIKKLLIFGILGALIGGYFAYSMYNKPHRNIAEEKADFTVSSNQLFDDFENNEKEANEKYLDKVVEVSGTIIEISKDQIGSTVLTLEAKNAMVGGVLCTLIDKQEQYSENKTIKLKCKCTGFLMDVVLTECTIVKK